MVLLIIIFLVHTAIFVIVAVCWDMSYIDMVITLIVGYQHVLQNFRERWIDLFGALRHISRVNALVVVYIFNGQFTK